MQTTTNINVASANGDIPLTLLVIGCEEASPICRLADVLGSALDVDTVVLLITLLVLVLMGNGDSTHDTPATSVSCRSCFPFSREYVVIEHS